MNSFQILNAQGEALSMQVLDQEAAAFWGKEVHPKHYAYPEKDQSIEGTLRERMHAEMHNAMLGNFNWFDQIGWSIANQGIARTLDTWANVVHSMIVEDLGERLIKFNEKVEFESFVGDEDIHLNDHAETRIYGLMQMYQPMLDLINHWAAKGYTPKQIK